MVLTESVKGRERGFNHCNILGLENLVENCEDAWRKKWEVFRGFLDEGSEDLKRNLNVSGWRMIVRIGSKGDTKQSASRRMWKHTLSAGDIHH